MAEFDFELFSIFLPQYLSAQEKRALFQQLSTFPEGVVFYDVSGQLADELLQGDGWRGFIATDFEPLRQREVSGIVLSNSCDIDPANEYDSPPNILFAPLIRLSAYREALLGAGIADPAIESKLSEIRRQQVTNIFFLPATALDPAERIILLDDVHRHPLNHFLARERTKIFTLSQAAFYFFLIKLSIHSHRLGEGVHRFIPVDMATAAAR